MLVLSFNSCIAELSFVAIFSYIAILILNIPTPIIAAPLIATEADIEYKRYCSDALSDAIRQICGGRFNSLSRVYPDSVGGNKSLKRLVSDDMFLRVAQNGPIHLCCKRPCGYSELKLYCAPD